jgi:hypothetical protein
MEFRPERPWSAAGIVATTARRALTRAKPERLKVVKASYIPTASISLPSRHAHTQANLVNSIP